ENVAKKSHGHGMVGFALQRPLNLLKQGDIGEHGLTKQFLAGSDVGFGEVLSCSGDFQIAVIGDCETQHAGGINDRQQVVDFHQKFFGNVVEVVFTPPIV